MSIYKEFRGINFRRLNDDKIGIGINRSQFIAYLMSLPTDQKGWLNFDLVANTDPSQKAGYSHFLEHSPLKPRG